MEGNSHTGNGKGQHDHGIFERPDVAYEKSDVNIGAIVKFTIWLVIAGVLINLIAWGLFRYFSSREDRLEPPAPPLASRGADRLPPEPRLQGAPGSKFPLQSPMLEMDAYRQKEHDLLDSYGWVDQKAGTIRIPIERAKQLLLERGFSVRQGVSAAGNSPARNSEVSQPASETSPASATPARRQQ